MRAILQWHTGIHRPTTVWLISSDARHCPAVSPECKASKCHLACWVQGNTPASHVGRTDLAGNLVAFDPTPGFLCCLPLESLSLPSWPVGDTTCVKVDQQSKETSSISLPSSIRGVHGKQKQQKQQVILPATQHQPTYLYRALSLPKQALPNTSSGITAEPAFKT